MIRKPVLLITGAGGEIGHGLIERLAKEGNYGVVALDVRPLDPPLASLCSEAIVGSILDTNLLERISSQYEIEGIFHLAAMLSTRGEFIPETAHDINVQGTLNLLKLAVGEARNVARHIRFIFPSSIAVYGLPDRRTKEGAGPVHEGEYLMPTTMYGVNKLACEHLGRYYSKHYRQLAADHDLFHVDFRALRFPGLISAFTLPSGGTSDFAPEMLHAAASGQPYACFARPDTRIPFMAMPDAIDALIGLFQAPKQSLTSTVYNVGAFAPSAEEIRDLTMQAFDGAEIAYGVDLKRQAILDTWPADVDDALARRDWGYTPVFTVDRAFDEYLVPTIKRLYQNV